MLLQASNDIEQIRRRRIPLRPRRLHSTLIPSGAGVNLNLSAYERDGESRALIPPAMASTQAWGYPRGPIICSTEGLRKGSAGVALASRPAVVGASPPALLPRFLSEIYATRENYVNHAMFMGEKPAMSARENSQPDTPREQAALTLSHDASLAFAELLLNPPQPNRNARVAAERFKARLVSQPAAVGADRPTC